MTDGIATGLSHALWLLGYLTGALLPLLVVAALFALGWYGAQWTAHQRSVLRVRRQARRSGRTT